MAPRLKEKYYNELAAKLKDELGIENVNDIPKLEKIVVNMGVGDAATDSKLMDAAVEDLRGQEIHRNLQAACRHADRR